MISVFQKKVGTENWVKEMLFAYLGQRGVRKKFPLRPVIIQRDQNVAEERRPDRKLNECGLCNFELSYIADFLGQGKAHPQKNKVK